MKKIFLLVYLLSNVVVAQYHYHVDNTLQVGPGMIYKHVKVPEKLWNINILEIDLTNPMVKIETVKAKDAYIGRENTSAMAKRNSYAGHQVVGAINADFFSSEGIPINVQVIKGQMLRNPIAVSTIGFDQENNPCLGIVAFSGMVFTRDDSHAINRVNGVRNTDETVLYNRFYGSTTATNQWGTEVAIRPISPWVVNDTIRVVVEAKETLKGDMNIPEGGAVLSAHGNAMTFFDNKVQVGDTLSLVLNLTPALPRLMEMVGGYPKIVYKGENWADEGYQEEGGPGHAYQVHPRTAIGFNSDSTKLYFFTVDGRRTGVYQGMTLPELADVMIDFGVAYGLNLDGGGSTTFVLRNEIVNHPSDGSERPVANAVLAVSTAPQGNFGHIQIEPDNVKMYFQGRFQFNVSGWDEYYNPFSINTSQVQFWVDSTLGQIQNDGLFVATVNGGSGYVYAQYQQAIDSAFVQVIGLQKIDLQPKFAATDTIQPISLSLKALTEDGKTISPSLESITWQVTNEQVGYVEDGKFWGTAEGRTFVIARLDTLVDSIEIKVEIGTDWKLIDMMDDLTSWHLDGQNYDSLHSFLQLDTTQKTAGKGALRLDYQFEYSAAHKADFYLKKQIPIYGLPEKIGVDFKSDGENHKLFFVVSDNDGELFKTDKRGYLNDSTQFVTVLHPTSSFSALENFSQFNYPIQLEYIWFRPGSHAQEGQIAKGSVYFDFLRVEYPVVTSLIPLTAAKMPTTVQLLPNFPNPFNPVTHIRFELPQATQVKLKIFDMRGRLVQLLLNQRLSPGIHQVEWQARDVASGIYFCWLQANGQTKVQKMILLK